MQPTMKISRNLGRIGLRRAFSTAKETAPLSGALPGITSSEEFYRDWEKRWDSLAENRLPLNQHMYEQVRRKTIVDGVLVEKKAVNPPNPDYIPEKPLDITKEIFAKGGRKTSKAFVYVLPNGSFESYPSELKDFINSQPKLKEDLEKRDNTDETLLTNGRPMHDYFFSDYWLRKALLPLSLAKSLESVKIVSYIKGGGVTGQAEALRHALSKGLLIQEPLLKKALKDHGFSVRDPRMVERKKPGQKKARKKFTWVKR